MNKLAKLDMGLVFTKVPIARYYEAAKAALTQAVAIDEVKEVHNQAMAFAEYARQAKDTKLLSDATELRFRAERRAGEMLARQAKAKGGAPYHHTGSDPLPVKDQLPVTLDQAGITKTESSKWQKLAALLPEKFEIRVEHAKARVEGMTTSAPSYPKAEYTGENEWFTPADWIELAREVLGEIDLDPASHVLAQERVQAKAFFTAADDGLAQTWFGRVWLNPPYNRALLAPFVDKLIAEVASGNVKTAILLTHNYTDTEWFHTAASLARAVCFPRGRIHFLSPAGDECSPTQGQAFFYYGANALAFRQRFSEVGLVFEPRPP